MEELWFPAYFVVIMVVAATNAKALGVSVVAAIGLLTLYPDVTKASMVTLFLLALTVLASFRD